MLRPQRGGDGQQNLKVQGAARIRNAEAAEKPEHPMERLMEIEDTDEGDLVGREEVGAPLHALVERRPAARLRRPDLDERCHATRLAEGADRGAQADPGLEKRRELLVQPRPAHRTRTTSTLPARSAPATAESSSGATTRCA